MIRVLQVISSIGTPGGVQSLLWNYYKYIDESQIRFDFAVNNDVFEGFEKRFLNKGCNIYYVPPKKRGIIKHYQELCRVMRHGGYDIVHTHQDFLGYLTLLAAKNCGIKTRIVHSHKANLKENIYKKLRHKVLLWITKMFATDFFACGEEAAIWTYGNSLFQKGKIRILKNAIETEQFIFDVQSRKRIRNELEIGDKLLIGNVARFTSQKNHTFLIDIFSKLVEIRNDVVLVLVGDGELLDEIKNKVHDNSLEDKVVFLGARMDVSELLQAMDVFVLPSLFEGLPVTLVEAQTSDLPCVVASNVTHEIQISKNIRYISLEENPEVWAKSILEVLSAIRKNNYQEAVKQGYDINNEANNLAEYYKKCAERT